MNFHRIHRRPYPAVNLSDVGREVWRELCAAAIQDWAVPPGVCAGYILRDVGLRRLRQLGNVLATSAEIASDTSFGA
jgi:hypothetical protein